MLHELFNASHLVYQYLKLASVLNRVMTNCLFVCQDFKEDGNPEEKARRHKELEVSSFNCYTLFKWRFYNDTLTLSVLFKAESSI